VQVVAQVVERVADGGAGLQLGTQQLRLDLAGQRVISGRQDLGGIRAKVISLGVEEVEFLLDADGEFGEGSAFALCGDAAEQCPDLGLLVAPVAAEGADRAELAGLGPPSHGLGVDPEHGRHLGRGEEGFGFR
jgi:hypothetical protein